MISTHGWPDPSRETASPPESEYENYIYQVEVAPNEATMVGEMLPLLKSCRGQGYHRVLNQPFTGFPKEVGFNNGQSAPQPDLVEGLEKREYRPFPVDELISGAVLYKDDPYSVTLPHLAGEWKGRGKDMDEARQQSAFDGAALVYARNQAVSRLGKAQADPPAHAEVITFTTDGTNLNMFAHYAAPSEDGALEYHQYPITSTNLINSHQGLKDGRRWLRNGQDHAREQSYALRDQLKEHWKQQRSASHAPIAEGTPPFIPQETNADETEDSCEVIGHPCQPTPAASAQPCGASSSVFSSKLLPPTDGCIPNSGGQKRKASPSSPGSPHELSRQRSRDEGHRQWDAERGLYWHKHSDGTVTWYNKYSNVGN